MDVTKFPRTRYETKNFTSKNYKKVPHEELDYGIYKNPNLVAFQTTESRLPMWVEALYMRYAQNDVFNNENNEVRTKWTEENDASDASKCEEISIEITHKNETMLTIRIFATKGRIQVNGRLMKAWGSEEFDRVRAIINNNEEATANTTVFLNKVLKKKETHLDTNTETDNSPGEEPVRTLKDIIANLESKFVSHKVDANTKLEEMHELLEEMHELLEKKEKEIATLKEEISKLKTTNNNQQQAISHLDLKHLKTEENIKHLQSELKNEKKESKKVPIKKPPIDKNTPQDKIESTPPTDAIPNCTIPTANRFDTLTETHPPLTDISNTIPNTSENTTTIPEETTATQHTATQHPKPVNTVNAETIILCDSNGRNLKPSILCPNTTTRYIRCPTITHGISITQETQFPKAKTFIIHCGTNDIEQLDASETLENLKMLVSQFHNKYPQSQVIVSLLLPRADKLNQTVNSLNENIEKELKDTPKTVTVKHTNIEQHDLKDRKHLTPKGVKQFLHKRFNRRPKRG